jgi:UDP-2-acetamido-2,6-beta-L-arabino-hexul-4-ose reductase
MLRLSELGDTEARAYSFEYGVGRLEKVIEGADWVIHLAGVNRPQSQEEFHSGNVSTIDSLCSILAKKNPSAGVLLASSAQAELNNNYGISKAQAEDILKLHSNKTGCTAKIFRFPNVFGKWCRPNYNSVVATFCHNIIHGIPVEIHDADARVNLVYIDDVISALVGEIHSSAKGCSFQDISPVYQTTVGELADQIYQFHQSRNNLMPGEVGTGLNRALYSTYISYLPVNMFVYNLKSNTDPRGQFGEVLRTVSSGQVSFFTAHPGVTRGGHYHHTKTEKFLVVAGKARFKFRNMSTGETHEEVTEASKPQIVETVPGWAHDITNIGDSEMVVLLWANEVFNPDQPDTIGYGLS